MVLRRCELTAAMIEQFLASVLVLSCLTVVMWITLVSYGVLILMVGLRGCVALGLVIVVLSVV